MTLTGKTKDEKFLLALYEASKAKGEEDPFQECDKYEVGQSIGLHPKGIDTICNLLAQANFIKKREGAVIVLTSNGEKLVQTLMGQ